MLPLLQHNYGKLTLFYRILPYGDEDIFVDGTVIPGPGTNYLLFCWPQRRKKRIAVVQISLHVYIKSGNHVKEASGLAQIDNPTWKEDNPILCSTILCIFFSEQLKYSYTL